MLISDYMKLDLSKSAAEFHGGHAGKLNCKDGTYAHYVTIRSKKCVYLYDEAMKLVNVLDLRDFGILDKRKKVQYNDREFEVDDGARQNFLLELKQKLICTWSEDDGLSLWNFDGSQRFHMPGAISEAYFDQRNDVLWMALRNDNDNVTVSVMDYEGTVLASLPMADPLCQSLFLFTPLPEKNRICILFGGGQDGCQDYFLEWQNDKLEIIKTLPADLSFLFCNSSGKNAILLDFYSEQLFRCTYPNLEEIGRYEYQDWEESMPGDVTPLNDEKAIIHNGYDDRYYLFDLVSMGLLEEIIVEGYEPKVDKNGECTSDVRSMRLDGDKVIIYFSRGFDANKEEWVAVCDVDRFLVEMLNNYVVRTPSAQNRKTV